MRTKEKLLQCHCLLHTDNTPSYKGAHYAQCNFQLLLDKILSVILPQLRPCIFIDVVSSHCKLC